MSSRLAVSYEKNVFINCPFDEEYLPLFRAATFTIMFCGHRPRCALEVIDAGEVRMAKILRLIRECCLGLHDISRTSLDPQNQLPRFNMPLELGIFIGAGHFGGPPQRKKSSLILDVERYRYQKYISDIAGQDIKAHHNQPEKIISAVRDWLVTASSSKSRLPGGRDIAHSYKRYVASLNVTLRQIKLHESEIGFADWLQLIQDWLRDAQMHAS